MKRFSFWLPMMVVVLALCAWGALCATPDLVWDDLQFSRRFAANSWAAAFGYFNFGQDYWRPIGTATLAGGMALSPWLGSEGAIVASKWFSLALWAAGSALVLLHVERASAASGRPRAVAACMVSAIFLSLAPAFAETTIWLSARYDLLLSLAVAFCVWDSNVSGKSLARGVAAGVLLGMCKESGVVWAVMAGVLTSRAGEKSYGRGLVLGGVGFAAIRQGAIAAGKLYPALFAASGGAAMASASCPGAPLSAIHGAGGFDALQSLGREALYLAAPWMDTNPMHPYWGGALWASALGLAVLGASVALLGSMTAKWTARLDFPWLASALAMMCFHAAISAFAIAPGEAHSYAIVSARYVSPSAMVFVALGCAWLASARIGGKSLAWGWILAAAIGIGNAWEAQASRQAWSTGMRLWAAAYGDAEHRNMVPTLNYVAELAASGNRDAAKKIAVEYAQSQPKGFDACRIDAMADGH